VNCRQSPLGLNGRWRRKSWFFGSLFLIPFFFPWPCTMYILYIYKWICYKFSPLPW
jgi:hypothetical protein